MDVNAHLLLQVRTVAHLVVGLTRIVTGYVLVPLLHDGASGGPSPLFSGSLFHVFVTIPLEIYCAMLFMARHPTFGYSLVALVIGTDA
jgi:hypothetical protein